MHLSPVYVCAAIIMLTLTEIQSKSFDIEISRLWIVLLRTSKCLDSVYAGSRYCAVTGTHFLLLSSVQYSIVYHFNWLLIVNKSE